MRVMVAVDASSNAKKAFFEALKFMNRERDELYLIHVADRVTPLYGEPGPSIAGVEMLVQAQKAMNEAGKRLLGQYSSLCKQEQVQHVKLLLSESSHVGQAVCDAAEEHKVDWLFLGRRGMSSIKRFFVGSTSKYCTEHAVCNVATVKGDLDVTPPHKNTTEIQSAEMLSEGGKDYSKPIEEEEEEVKSTTTTDFGKVPSQLSKLLREKHEQQEESISQPDEPKYQEKQPLVGLKTEEKPKVLQNQQQTQQQPPVQQVG